MEETTKPKKKKKSNRARAVGHTWERDCRDFLIEIGFEHVCTTRLESKARDAKKVDLMNKDEYKNGRLPINVQCKNLVMNIRGKNFVYPDFAYPDILNTMPSDGQEINVIFHNMTEKRKEKFYSVGQFAHLKLYDFLMLVKELKELREENTKLKQL